MTSDELVTFITLAQSKSFSRTAELLFTSQSTISFRLRNLEAQVGKSLFDRSTRRIELTPAGKDFLFYATQIESLYKESLHAVAKNSFDQKITIGAPNSFWESTLLPIMIPILHEKKNVAYDLVVENSIPLNQLLLDDKVDLAISFVSLRNSNFECFPLAKTPFVLVAHKDTALPEERMTLQNSSSFPLIFCHWTNDFNVWFRETYCIRSHAIEVKSAFLFLQLLRQKLGVGFWPLRVAYPYIISGEFISIDYDYADNTPLEENYLLYNRKHFDQIQPFAEAILAQFSEENSCFTGI